MNDNLTYVGIVDGGYDGGITVLYAGYNVEVAHKRIREFFSKYESCTLEYYVSIWRDGEEIATSYYDEEEDVFE